MRKEDDSTVGALGVCEPHGWLSIVNLGGNGEESADMPHHFATWRISSRSSGVQSHLSAHVLAAQGAPSFRFSSTKQSPLVYQIPSTLLARSSCAMMHGLALSLPESGLDQSPPLRLMLAPTLDSG